MTIQDNVILLYNKNIEVKWGGKVGGSNVHSN